MSNIRITSELWVSAFRKRLESHAVPFFIIKKGDHLAGSIILRVSDLRGKSKILTQGPSIGGERQWIEIANGPDIEIDKKLKKQSEFDDDVWIIEIEQVTGVCIIEDFLLIK